MSVRLVLTIALAASAAVLVAADADYTHEQYTAEHGKTYATAAERAHRAAVFARNLAAIRAHNAGGESGFTRGVNAHTDATAAELSSRNGYRPTSPADTKARRAQAHVTTHVVSGKPLPASVDYRASVPAVLTAVKNQGRCGSCWAHGAAETLEAHWAIATGELFVLSQQQIASCATNPKHCGGYGGCEGSTPDIAYEYLVNTKDTVASTWQYPYESFGGQDFKCKIDANSTNTDVWVAGYTLVTPNDQAAIMDALAFTGPIAIVVDASGWSSYAGGIFDGAGCNFTAQKSISFDHVVQLVGYGTDAAAKQDYWVVRNSWGPTWGEAGYIRLRRHAAEQCGLNTNTADCRGNSSAPQVACGPCGMFFDAVYPTVTGKPQPPPAGVVTATMHPVVNLTAFPRQCSGAAGTTMAVGKCTGNNGVASSWLSISADATWFALLENYNSYNSGTCNATLVDAYFSGYYPCDVPFSSPLSDMWTLTGCAASNLTLHHGCNPAGGNCTKATPLPLNKCAVAGFLGVKAVSTTQKRTATVTQFDSLDCSGVSDAAAVICDECTTQGLVVCPK
jgi:cathepsin L